MIPTNTWIIQDDTWRSIWNSLDPMDRFVSYESGYEILMLSNGMGVVPENGFRVAERRGSTTYLERFSFRSNLDENTCVLKTPSVE
jgi:hypothetical protein